MCRRYALTSSPARLREHFGYAETPDFPPRESITPNQPIAVVTSRNFTRGVERRFHLVRWGFLPGFVDDPGTFPLIANARGESLLDKPSFAAAFKRRRCLIPADGFYAGRGSPMFRAADEAPLAFAGLYETYLDANGSEIDTACVVTVAANGLVSAFADRMPALLARDDFSAWLDGDATPPLSAQALLRPAPEPWLRAVKTFR